MCHRPGTVKVDVTSGHGEDSWEARMTQACQSKFAVSPRKGDAIVFYSQHPDGNVNPASLRTYRRWHLWQHVVIRTCSGVGVLLAMETFMLLVLVFVC